MRKFLTALAALCYCYAAHATPSTFKGIHPDHTYEDGRLKFVKSSKGVTKFEYRDGKVSRKILPDGRTIDFYYGRDGKIMETRFSSGLVRTYQRNRAGQLIQIVGSNSYTKTLRDTTGAKVLLFTGPNGYRNDLTEILRKTEKSILARMIKFGGAKVRPLVQKSEDGGGSCGFWTVDTGYDCFGNGGGGDGGGGDYWGEDVGGGEYGDDSGDDYDDDTWGGDTGYGGSGGEGSGGGTPTFPPAPPNSNGDNAYYSCMTRVCEPANKRFREFCGTGHVPPNHYARCMNATVKEYFNCEVDCRYRSY